MTRALRFDKSLAWLELRLAASLLAVMLGIMVANAVMRTAGHPLIWAEELSVLLMAVSALFGISANIATGQHITVDLLARRLGRLGMAGGALLLFAATLGFVVCLWVWFDPLGLWRHGSAEAFARATLNFVYDEPTMTLGVPKAWFWLAFVPATLGCAYHAAVRIACLRQEAPC